MSAGAKIATVTLNPAIDQTIQIPNFAMGEVNRVASEQSDAGGKGVNVASFLAQFGHKIAVTGFLGKDNAHPFEQLFGRLNIDDRFVRLAGATRVNIKIVDPDKQEITDINAPGLTNCAEGLAALEDAIDQLAANGTEQFVLAGSLPAGLPQTIYRDLISHLKGLGKEVILDASGPSFAAALDAGPDIIKPNVDELSELVGRNLKSHEEIITAARAVTGGRVGLIVVSMGADGALFITEEDVLHAMPKGAVVKSTVGAGDAMVAGILHSRSEGLPLADLARLATGFSLGALGEIGPHLPAQEVIKAFAADVVIEKL
ncbi:fructose-1-phosphate kinase [Cohaesibacter marisflavi]|uniref:Phosphofructokinase n=1 Tax=Cohaesibacter marisflavi TaxID=655353 RepID=A0A1I5CM77_9HYPH|nr:1-phosphofructokinase [Cohaesibacter marisflavi]SFN88068.1 fructose-1-phosphate kinase [Cohaesibacter marisflavi]